MLSVSLQLARERRAERGTLAKSAEIFLIQSVGRAGRVRAPSCSIAALGTPALSAELNGNHVSLFFFSDEMEIKRLC